MSPEDDGTNDFGLYKGFFNYFIPDSSIVMTMSVTAIFMGFLLDIKKLTKHESTTKEFPIIPLGIYLISSMFMFMFVFGNGTTDHEKKNLRRLVEETTSLTESSTLCVIGKIGYFLSMLWGSFYAFYFFSETIKRIGCIVAFILSSFIAMAIISLILRIPFINRIIITIMYTAFSLVPGYNIQKIYLTHDKSLFNNITLFGTFVLCSTVAYSYCKSMKAHGFVYTGLIAILNFLIVSIFVGFYYYLLYKYGDMPKKDDSGLKTEPTDNIDVSFGEQNKKEGLLSNNVENANEPKNLSQPSENIEQENNKKESSNEDEIEKIQIDENIVE